MSLVWEGVQLALCTPWLGYWKVLTIVARQYYYIERGIKAFINEESFIICLFELMLRILNQDPKVWPRFEVKVWALHFIQFSDHF